MKKYTCALYGAILGDLVGSQNNSITSNTIMVLATAEAMINKVEYHGVYEAWINKYLDGKSESIQNTCLSRICPIMYSNQDIDEEVIKTCLNFPPFLNPSNILAVIDLAYIYQVGSLDRINHTKPFRKLEKITKPNLEIREVVDFIDTAYWSFNSTQKAIEEVIKCSHGLEINISTNASIIGELMNYTFNDLKEEDVKYVESNLDSHQLNTLYMFNRMLQFQ